MLVQELRHDTNLLAHTSFTSRDLSDARSLFQKGNLVNQIHEHGRDRDVVNRACGFRG